MNRILALLPLGMLLLNTALASEDAPAAVYSYTMEEMYEMADSLKSIQDGENLSTIEYMAAAEFKGYVAAVMDSVAGNDVLLSNCARQNRIGNIAARAARLMTSVPLDRSQNAAISVHTALRFVCD